MATLYENDCNTKGKCRQLWEIKQGHITQTDRGECASKGLGKHGSLVWVLMWVGGSEQGKKVGKGYSRHTV